MVSVGSSADEHVKCHSFEDMVCPVHSSLCSKKSTMGSSRHSWDE